MRAFAWLFWGLLVLTGCETAEALPPKKAPESAGLSRTVRHAGADWLTFELDLGRVDLRLLGQRTGEPHTFQELEQLLGASKSELVMATNAGIFDTNLRPLGLHVEDGELLVPLSTANGEGNFFLKPNGVFWVDDASAHVASSEAYVAHGKVRLATQSGPLLVSEGRLHPAFDEHSNSLRVRSGVGVDRHGRVHVVLSLASVPFFSMATLFRDVLDCPNALYLDGEISGILGPGLPRPPSHAYGGLLVATGRLSAKRKAAE
jgi:uncharacterized protein YigE (DUF2233 family)